MTNFTLKASVLLILALFSIQATASSPWANETVADETATDQTTEVQEPAEAMPETQFEGGRPGMEEETIAPVAEQAKPEPVVNPQTVQQGDVLSAGDTVAVKLLDFPRRGMTTDKVENELGRPSEIIPSIGQPPITRWVYDDRTVYFEYSTVLHVVAK